MREADSKAGTGNAGVLTGAAWFALAAVLCTAHFASFDIVERPLVTDIRYYLYFAREIADGAVPHRDYVGNKTALASFTGAFLYTLGAALGVDPLHVIRAGYLAIAAAGGLLVFAIHRRLGGGSPVAGLLGVLAYCSFSLLGVLPAIGNVPKLLVAVLGSAMGLLVFQRRWLLAGVAGALAFMDWQVGALAWLAAFVCAALLGRPRLRACALVSAGGAAALAPFVLYYAFAGALREAWDQTVAITFLVGGGRSLEVGFGHRIDRMRYMVDLACPGHGALFHVALAGIPVALWQLWKLRRSERARLLLPLCLFYGGLVGWSLLDFQLYGDFFLLLHCMAFFLAMLWTAVFGALSQRLPGRAGLVLALVFLVLAFAAARPSVLHVEVGIPTASTDADASLADQRQVASLVRRLTRHKRLVLLDAAELLWLLPQRNPLPIAYFNDISYTYLRKDEESPDETATRLLRSVEPDAFVYIGRATPRAEFDRDFFPTQMASANGRYRVRLYRRKPGSAGPRAR